MALQEKTAQLDLALGVDLARPRHFRTVALNRLDRDRQGEDKQYTQERI
jgi:hypothetical protein